jgi:RimJ/RimL family protein N-acetyltransferase
MALPVPELTDGVIRLRLPVAADAEAIFQACQDPTVAEFTRIPVPYTRVHANGFVRAAAQMLRAETGAHLLITPADDTQRLLGSAGVTWDRSRQAAEVGYWLARDARGRGVASRSVLLLARWAFQTLGVQRFQAMVDVRNAASQRVVARCGFQREGVLRSWDDRFGRRVDFVMFSLLPDEFPAGEPDDGPNHT